MVEFQKKYPINKYLLVVISSITFIGTMVASVLMLTRGDYINHLKAYSYLGLFVIALITGSPLPIPTFCVLLVFTMGSVYNPILVGLTAGLGVAIGHMMVYWSGFGGYQLLTILNVPDWVNRQYSKTKNKFIKKPKTEKFLNFVNRHAIFSMFLMSVIPNPFQLPSLLILGAKRASFWKVFAACWVGRTILYVFLAYMGYFGLHYWRITF
jgi:membrane protein YqaA with SNARE-associated domain